MPSTAATDHTAFISMLYFLQQLHIEGEAVHATSEAVAAAVG